MLSIFHDPGTPTEVCFQYFTIRGLPQRPNQRHFGRSHSSAILPLRKHLIEKSLAEKRSMDDNQYYYQQNKIERERTSRNSFNKPLEEVMEEDGGVSTPADLTNGTPRESSMEELQASPERVVPVYIKKPYFKGFMGPSGISPLVLSELYLFSLQYILTRLVDTGILANCEQVSEMGTLEQIQSCHTEAHTLLFGTGTNVGLNQEGDDTGALSKFTVLPCGGLGVDSDTYWNQLYTATAARFAVGSTVELALKIARGEIKNGFAVVRPPGHHAEAEEAMGFCYFNTIAIAAKQLLEHTSTRRILIIDWAIHHGNGVQKIFYNDPRVLYISIHRGLGHNVNIAWSGGLEPPMADAEYLAAFRSVVMPIARCYEPDFVLVSAGFDAAVGHEHPIGGYQVSTACFAFLTHHLMSLAGGRVQLVLEGGYHTTVLADGVEQCTRALLGEEIEKISFVELGRRPNKNAVDALQKTQAIQSQYWPILTRYGSSVLLSHLETWEKEREEVETLSAMAYLSMQHMH
ncbi:histone deacetylase 4-like [Eurytemora carolleeae]|uniref:histone deacetylase 4-like n=1 Tax=Eurytemora carolleeae TaxID=1294199 RepID=UPI000C77EDBA|nr:histone deacetylase 4-like [Eurytemora carolleeae]|eukprot:XP_023329584.1 histone deacetylase 4-like [Eurytemora affinis]